MDYLVYELGCLDSGKIIDGTQFPIEDREKGFAYRKKGGWLNGLNAAHIAAIEALQPYKGCNWSAMLRELSNPDKHRQLVPHRAIITASLFVDADRIGFLNFPGSVTRAKSPVSGDEMDVKLAINIEILFSDGTPVIQTLDELQAGVTGALGAFHPDFE